MMTITHSIALLNNMEAHLRAFGYIRLPGVLNEVIYDLYEEFEKQLPPKSNNTNHDRYAKYFIPSSRYNFKELVNRGIVSNLLNRVGSDKVILEECNILRGNTHWHRDGKCVPPKAYRVVAYLDPIRIKKGALSVIPSSHLEPNDWPPSLVNYLPLNEGRNEVTYESKLKDIPCDRHLISDPGDVIIFDCNILHSSFGGTERRQIALVTVASPKTTKEKEQLLNFFLNRYLSSTLLFR